MTKTIFLNSFITLIVIQIILHAVLFMQGYKINWVFFTFIILGLLTCAVARIVQMESARELKRWKAKK